MDVSEECRQMKKPTVSPEGSSFVNFLIAEMVSFSGCPWI